MLMEDGDRPDMPGVGPHGGLDTGPLPRPPLLLGADPNRLMLLTGDCVLPRITPNVNLNPQTEPDPLGDYLQVTGEVGGVRRHRGAARARVALRRPQHAAAPRSVPTTSTGSSRWSKRSSAGYDTAWEVAPRMDWSRPWDQIDGFMRRSTIGEAYAHLRALDEAGRARGVGR